MQDLQANGSKKLEQDVEALWAILDQLAHQLTALDRGLRETPMATRRSTMSAKVA